MSAFDWESFLRQWSQAILETMDEEEQQLLPPEVLASGWLGYPGATEAEIGRAEARLRVKLPPSYREFLKVTNGWRQTADQANTFNHRFWSTEDVERFATRHPQWIRSFIQHQETTDIALDDEPYDLDNQWESIGISDNDYFKYGEEQDPSKLRVEYLQTAIAISDVGLGSIYLLNPQVAPDGEWEAWFFADYLPGADRYRSFQEMMEAEYQAFLELREPVAEVSEVTSDAPENSELIATHETEAVSLVLEPEPALLEETIDPLPALTADVEPLTWQSLKRLTVEFQARQVDDQADYRTIVNAGEPSQPQIWKGLKEQRLQLWLRQHLADAKTIHVSEAQIGTRQPMATNTAATIPFAQAQSAIAVSESRPSLGEKITEAAPQREMDLAINVEIQELSIRQPSNQILIRSAQLRRSQPVGLGSLDSRQPFSVEVEFHLAGQCVDSTTLQDVFYKVQVFAQNRTTHQWIELGTTRPAALTDSRQPYMAGLFNKTLEPGMYRLHVITSLSGVVTALSSLELPLLNMF